MAQEWENEAIKAAGRRWQDAYSRGDTGGMESAHAEAEALRAKAGYSGGTNGDKRISLNTSSPSSGLGYGVRPVTYDAEAEIARNNYIRSLATGETPVPVSRNDKLYIEPIRNMIYNQYKKYNDTVAAQGYGVNIDSYPDAEINDDGYATSLGEPIDSNLYWKSLLSGMHGNGSMIY